MNLAQEARLVLSTAATAEEGSRLARSVVEQGLAACVNIVPAVRSIYRWQGTVCDDAEVLLLIKTTQQHLPELEEAWRRLHPYEVPEFLVLRVDSGAAAYLAWLASAVTPASPSS